MSSGSSDGRQGAASPHAPAASSSPLTAEDAERFASVLKPMWELDSASQPAAPLAPPSKPRVANPAVTVKARQPQPAPTSRDSSHEFDDLAQLPHGPSAAPDAMGVVAAPVTIPEPELEPEGASAVAVQPHLPPRRQQISEPRHSVEVDAPPPQTVPSAFLQTAPGHADSTGPAVAQPAYGGGPTVEQLRARAARGQPTMVINKREASFPGRRSRAPWVIGLGLLVLGGGAAAALFMTAVAHGGRRRHHVELRLQHRSLGGARDDRGGSFTEQPEHPGQRRRGKPRTAGSQRRRSPGAHRHDRRKRAHHDSHERGDRKLRDGKRSHHSQREHRHHTRSPCPEVRAPEAQDAGHHRPLLSVLRRPAISIWARLPARLASPMHLRSSCVAVLVSLTSVAALAPIHSASAQTSAHPRKDASRKSEAAQIRAARAKFQEGVRSYDRKDYDKARNAFLEAYRLHAHPAIFLNIAQSSLRTGRTLEAARYFRRFLHEDTPSLASTTTAQQGLNEAEETLGRLEIKGSAGLDTYVDGESVGTTPLSDPIDVAPGPHQVRIGTTDQQVVAVAGQPTVVNVVPPTALAAQGQAAPAAATATSSTSNKPGPFHPPAHMLPVYIAGGVAVAGFATAIIAAVGHGKASDSATSATALINAHGGNGTTCSSTDAATVAKFGEACSALSTDNSQASTDGTVRDVGLIVGAVALVGGIVYYFVAPKSDSSAPGSTTPTPASGGLHLDVTPILGQTTQGLSLTGTF